MANTRREHSQSIPAPLVRALGRGDAVALVGPGLGGAFPDDRSLADRLARDLGRPVQPGETVAQVAQAYVLAHGPQSLHARVLAAYDDPNVRPTPAHRAVARLFDRVLTTAYDTLLEAALRAEGRRVTAVVRDPEAAYSDSETVLLVKLRGCVSRPDSLVVAEDDYWDWFHLHPTVRNVLGAMFATQTLLLLGCDLDAPTFQRVFRDVGFQVGRHRRWAYAVLPGVAPDSELARTWERRNVQVLDADPGAFLAELERACPPRRREPVPPPPLTPADHLADTVTGLLEAMGYQVLSRQPAGRFRVNLTAQPPGLLANQNLAVGCKEGLVSVRDVTAAASALEQGACASAFLVAETRVAPAARQLAQTLERVQVYTLGEFRRRLIDFDAYVQSLVEDYEGSELAHYYVDLGAARFERDERGQIVSEDHFKPLDDCLDDWLGESGRNHISLLGDYGTGKTSFCRQYAARLARRHQADPDQARVPVLISLRDYATAMNLEQLITDFLVNRQRVPVTGGFAAFQRLNADGQLLLIFDGFDEMALKVDAETTVANFWELARAVVPGSKVLLTCRTPYFRTAQEARELLGWDAVEQDGKRGVPHGPSSRMRGRGGMAGKKEGKETVIDLADKPNFEILHLDPFTDEDIQAVLRKRFPDRWADHWDQVQRIYNLPELARRPVLLDMICATLPTLQPGQTLNAARLYQTYTNQWLERDVRTGRTFVDMDDKRLFMEALALEMHQRGELSLHFGEFPDLVKEHFRLERADEIDYFARDIYFRACLSRDDEGHYRFAHKSFLEFFAAQWIGREMRAGRAPDVRLNEEMRGFVHGLFEDVALPAPDVVAPEGMVYLPPGPFVMGGSRYEDEQPIHVAALTRGVFIDRCPVTNARFAQFVQATGHVTVAEREGWGYAWTGEDWDRVQGADWRHPRGPGSSIEGKEDHPVVQVSWRDATAYCQWLAETIGQPYRLPTEAEWERAARGTDGREYPWGDGWDPQKANTDDGGPGTTTPVGAYSPAGDSPAGCADMAGNVWEWTSSKWGPDWERPRYGYPYRPDDGREDPAGDDLRVVRGGSWGDLPEDARCAFRGWGRPEFRFVDQGFRCARG